MLSAMAFHLVSGTLNPTNAALLEAFRNVGIDARLTPGADLAGARPGDVALGRLDVLPTLEGVETGMWELRRAKNRGVQELVPPCGYDLRVIVAAGQVTGAIERVAADGEWRTNVALGGWRRRTDPQ